MPVPLQWTWDREDLLGDLVNFLVDKPLSLAALFVLGALVRWLLHRMVDRLVLQAEDGVLPDAVSDQIVRHRNKRAGRPVDTVRDPVAATRRVQRAKTIGDLLKSIITGVVVAVVGTMMLSEIGVDIAPIIASAGIIGIALGFGAQSLVKDFLSGVFMILEDQYGVGDVVDVGEASGTVEAVSLRVTRLRDINGTVWYVPNGEILRVGNMSQNWSRAVVDVGVGYGADLARVTTVLKDISHDLWEDDQYAGIIIEEPEVTGVESLAADGVHLRVLVKTAPMEQWGVARELRQRIKSRFDHEGIELPFPQRITIGTDPARS
mgnify:CR=1 FL=1